MKATMYTAVGFMGISVYHTSAFISIEDLKAHLETKPKGYIWHIMQTIELIAPSSYWDIEKSKPLKEEKGAGRMPIGMLFRLIASRHAGVEHFNPFSAL